MSHECCGPKVVENNSGVAPEDSLKSVYQVKGMDCADEVSAIQRTLKHASIFKIDTNLMSETVTVYHDDKITSDAISKLIEKSGVKVVSKTETSFIAGHKQQILILATSAIMLVLAYIGEWIEMRNHNLVLFLYVASILNSGILVFPKAFRAIKSFSLDMNVLMTVAVIGAFVIKEYSEAATVVFLFAFAEMLEALSVSRARKAIRDVLQITPKQAMIVSPNGQLTPKDVTTISKDEIVLVRPGESVPVDGIIIEGESSFNQAALTGESMPVQKKVGDKVLAGTINDVGAVKIKVESAFKDSKVSQIISLIENAQSQKAPSQRFVDKFAKIYTPAVLVFALFIAFGVPVIFQQSFDTWIYRALVMLVIGCPCALVIATPVSVVSGLTSLARRGVLVKGGVFLEALGQIKAIALDKTGTITEGQPRVVSLKVFSKVTEEEINKVAASLESMTTHPLATAILQYAKERNILPTQVTNYKHVSGRGAEGTIEGHPYFVGNHAFAHELGVCTPELEQYLASIEGEGLSVIIIGHKIHGSCDGEVLAVYSVGDTLKPKIADTIQNFHGAGVEKVVLLSGDNQKTVSVIAKKIGIDYARGDLLPNDKVEEMKTLVSQYKYVAMVGDGVNDAPALAHATVGIAMGVAGTDVAIETADVALMRDDVGELPKAIKHGKLVLNVIRFNIAFAIAIKVVFFALALFGYSTLWMAVASDMGASLLVTFNALRLLRN
ncbi:MAG: cation-translocating P-type ATPase [Bacteriovoracaceae bacterium]|nr:cation-translocating P-type ATPase [Bacteriovoracaceae bacterium]